jgi:hypothetical protein
MKNSAFPLVAARQARISDENTVTRRMGFRVAEKNEG